MAIKIIKNSDKCAYGVKEYILDTEADVALLPFGISGSVAVVLKTANVYTPDSNGNWKLLKGGRI